MLLSSVHKSFLFECLNSKRTLYANVNLRTELVVDLHIDGVSALKFLPIQCYDYYFFCYGFFTLVPINHTNSNR